MNICSRCGLPQSSGDLHLNENWCIPALQDQIQSHESRIAELEAALREMIDVGSEYYDMDCGENGSAAIKRAEAALKPTLTPGA